MQNKCKRTWTVDKIVVLSREVRFVQFYNHATIQQGTLAKLPSCERGFVVVNIILRCKLMTHWHEYLEALCKPATGHSDGFTFYCNMKPYCQLEPVHAFRRTHRACQTFIKLYRAVVLFSLLCRKSNNLGKRVILCILIPFHTRAIQQGSLDKIVACF